LKHLNCFPILLDQLNESVGASQDVLDVRAKERTKQEFNLQPITDEEDDPFEDDDFYTSDDDFDVSMHDEKQPEAQHTDDTSGNDAMVSEQLDDSTPQGKETDIPNDEVDVDEDEPLCTNTEENSHVTDALDANENIKNINIDISAEDHDLEKCQSQDSSTSTSEDIVPTQNSGNVSNEPNEDQEVDANSKQQYFVDKIVEAGMDQMQPILHVKSESSNVNVEYADDEEVERSETALDHDDNISKEEEEPLGSDESGDLSVYVSKEEAVIALSGSRNDGDTHDQKVRDLEAELADVKRQLMIQKEEMSSKDDQIFSMTQTFEREKKSLESKMKETKEEAKKRIAKAKEKVDALKSQLSDASRTANSSALTSSEQEEIIKALRTEGENLAKKQCDMEQLVRDARSDIKELKEDLEKERQAKETAEKKVSNLEEDLKLTRNHLSAAKAKGGLADKLDSDLLAAREEREKNAVIISNLELELKQAKAEAIEVKKQMDLILKEKANQMETQAAIIHKEKDSLLNDLETKLRTSEREANLREDSLRHEVAELRKRWQESVRRCDGMLYFSFSSVFSFFSFATYCSTFFSVWLKFIALSIDLQQTSGPLLRQLESAERQNRSRANAWAELETKLRSDLEESLSENLKLSKEKKELETKIKSLHREVQSKESDLETANSRLSDMSSRVSDTNERYEAIAKELDALQLEYTALEQRQKDKESKTISEMTITLRESEERFHDHIDSLEIELRQEREKRESLDDKIKEMMEKASGADILTSYSKVKNQKRNLGTVDGQANILQSTLMDINGNDEEDDDEVSDYQNINGVNNGTNSFAFMEEMTQALSAAKLEVETLRNQLDESQLHRSELESEISRIREHINDKDLEIRALEEDILEVRQMFRSQIDALMAKETPPTLATGKTKNVSNPSSLSSSFVGMRSF
jgi:chromosome segregation ATPase